MSTTVIPLPFNVAEYFATEPAGHDQRNYRIRLGGHASKSAMDLSPIAFESVWTGSDAEKIQVQDFGSDRPRWVSEMIGEIIDVFRIEFAARAQSWCTFIATLGIDGFQLKRTLPVTITPDGDGVIAAFLDANINTGADSISDAIADLQALLVEVFKDLEKFDDLQLGPEMLRQKHVLSEAICRTSSENTAS